MAFMDFHKWKHREGEPWMHCVVCKAQMMTTLVAAGKESKSTLYFRKSPDDKWSKGYLGCESERVSALKKMAPGTTVEVRMDDDTTIKTTTKSEPWEAYAGQWLVLLEGFSAGYDLSRVTPVVDQG